MEKGRQGDVNNWFKFLSSCNITRFSYVFYYYQKCNPSTNDSVPGMKTLARGVDLKMSMFWKQHWNPQNCLWEGNLEQPLWKIVWPPPQISVTPPLSLQGSSLDIHA